MKDASSPPRARGLNSTQLHWLQEPLQRLINSNYNYEEKSPLENSGKLRVFHPIQHMEENDSFFQD